MPDSSAATNAIKTDAGNAPGAVRLQFQPPADTDAGPARCTVLLCSPLPLAGDSSRGFVDALRDALLEGRCAVATYEAQSEAAILDDYHGYTALDALAEARSALNQLLHTGQSVGSIVLIGYGVGAIIAAALLDDARDALGLCVINPATPQGVSGPLAKRSEKAGDSSDAALPRAFIESIRELNFAEALQQSRCPVLVLNGAADDIVSPAEDRTFFEAARQNGRPATSLLIAQGNHALTDPHARQAVFEQVIGFIESLTAART